MGRVAKVKNIKYPMAGMDSETVQLGIYDLASQKTIYIMPRGEKEDYLTNITWSPDSKTLYVHELNRDQNYMQLNAFDTKTGRFLKTLYDEKSHTYVEPLHPIQFSKTNPRHFYALHNKDGYRHIYKYDIDGKLLHQLTKGEWEVSSILGFNADETKVFFSGTKYSPLESHIYSVQTPFGIYQRLSKEEGEHRATISSNGKYIIDRFQGPKVPNRELIRDTQGEIIETVLDSPDHASEYTFGQNEIVEIPSTDGKTTLYGRMILPPDFDASKKYPVIIYVYGGPHSQMVKKSWKNNARWWQYYMAQKGFICFTLDNRGTINRGREFEDVIHKNLGITETADQMAGIDYLKKLAYVDGERIGVHGWSYGGFMTLNMMLRHPDVCKVGVAGGPVVDWSMYEIMYGERYMDAPNDNIDGYKRTDMTTHIDSLKGKLMLIHGVQDDIVVMQHSMKFLRAAVKKGKQVDFFAYPTHPHNVRGMDRIHLMRKVSDYFIDNL